MSVKSYELKDICEIRSGKRLPKGTDFSECVTDYKYIRARDIKNGKINGSELVYISKDIHTKLSRYIVNTDDIVITIVGASVGDVAYVTDEFEGVNLTENAVRLTQFDECVNAKYLMYILNSKKYWELMQHIAGGAAQPKLGIYKIQSIVVELPERKTQDRVVNILSTYDDLIENNQKQIKLLEEAAQRLYKEWFVDLRFPGYENTPIVDGVPEGWVSCSLNDVIHFNPKVTLDKNRTKQFIPMSALSTSSMVLDSGEYTTTLSNSGSKFQNEDTLLARITPCLENGKTAFVFGIDSDEGAVGSTEYIVMRSKKLNPYIVYLLARTDDFRQFAVNSMSGSDGRQRVQVDKLIAYPYLNPPQHLIEMFAKLAEPIFTQIYTKNKQNIELNKARDRLLPKLMSGELEV